MRLHQSRFGKFLIVGGGCTCIDFILFYVAHLYCGYGLIISNIFSYGVGLTCAFAVNRFWTFADGTHKSLMQFVLSMLLGYIGLVLNTAIIWLLENLMHVMLAKCIAVIVVVFYNYFSNKWLVFKVR